MFKFTAATGGKNRLGLREMLQAVDGHRRLRHMSPNFLAMLQAIARGARSPEATALPAWRGRRFNLKSTGNAKSAKR